VINLISNPGRQRNPRLSPTLCGLKVVEEARKALSCWPGYKETPVVPLDRLARTFDLGLVLLKDESSRFGIGSFKSLGAAYAMMSIEKGTSGEGSVQGSSMVTVCCASDGNYGRAVSWAAKHLGYRCIVYLPEQVSRHREEAIVFHGAQTVRISGNYDEAVTAVVRDSSIHGWILVSDTSFSHSTAIPKKVMLGYAVMVHELADQIQLHALTHVFLQCGVGSFAGAVTAYLLHRFGSRCPTIVTVEPESAACIFASGRRGQMVTIRGPLDTIMAGLACGRPSPLAWQVLGLRADFFSTVSDTAAMRAMRVLVSGASSSHTLAVGETGAAGAAALLCIASQPELRCKIGIDSQSQILLFGTEGATDPTLYRAILSERAISE
jgi:diaminopropionate ammonia-lyase